jgi:hypothetical protein
MHSRLISQASYLPEYITPTRAVRLTENSVLPVLFLAPKNYTQRIGSFGFNFPFNAGFPLAKRPPDCRLKCLENNKPIVLFVHNMCLCINLSAQIVDVVIVIVVHLL